MLVLGYAFVVIFLCVIIYSKFWVNYCQSNNLLTGKTVLITGGNHGLGRTIAKELIKRNARVIIASRNLKKSSDAVLEIRSQMGDRPSDISFMQLDLADITSIHKFVEDFVDAESRLDYLVTNAGVVTRGKTAQGYDMIMGVNHLGHFLLTNLLIHKMNILQGENRLRIVNISSRSLFVSKLNIATMEQPNLNVSNLGLFFKYSDSKLAVTCFMANLFNKLNEIGCKNITVLNAFPGGFPSDLGKTKLSLIEIFRIFLINVFFKSQYKAAQTPLYCIVEDNLVNGGYYFDCRQIKMPPLLSNKEFLQSVWGKSAQLTEFSAFDH